MTGLEDQISAWRQQMLAAGIKSPVPLEELEIHLRDEIGQQMASGQSEQSAFDLAARQIGETQVLKNEFARAGETVFESVKQFFCALAGISNHQFATNMNTPNQNSEPGWATYLKSAAWIFPALFVWIGSCVFVLPRLKDVGSASNTPLPSLVMFQLAVADAIRMNFLLGAVIFSAALALVEWRWRGWARFRRLFFGTAAFCLNFSALFFLASLLIYAVLVASQLAHPQPFKP